MPPLTDQQKLAAKRLRDTMGISFPDSFARVLLPEVDVAKLAKEELDAMDAIRAEVVAKQPEPEVES